MDPQLRDVLRNTCADGSVQSHTHTTEYGPKAKWLLQTDSHEEFWRDYCNLVQEKVFSDKDASADVNLCLSEKSKDVNPLIADFTFKFHFNGEEECWEPYNDDLLQWLCHSYQNVLLENFRVTTSTNFECVAVVMESMSHWYEKGEDSNDNLMAIQVKIQFPYACVDVKNHAPVIRKKVIQYLRTNNVMAKMNRQPVNDWEQIILAPKLSDPIAMYGSCPVKGRAKMEMTHIWSLISKESLDNGIEPNEVPLEDAFVPNNHVHVTQTTVNSRLFDTMPLSHWLPLFFSVGYWPSVLLQNDVNRNNNNNTTSSYKFGSNAKYYDQSDSELCDRMVSMMGTSRFLTETFWMDIGKALHTSDNGGENGLLSWARNSERAVKGASIPSHMTSQGSISATCKSLYHNFSENNITLKTLAWYAREDFPDQYTSWHRDWCMSSMERALSSLHTDVATALYRVYWLDFAHCPTDKGRWFQFRNNRWSENHQGIELKKAMSSDFMKRFEIARISLSKEMSESTDESFRSNGEATLKKIATLIGRLKSVPFKRNIMTEAAEQFNNYYFLRLLDSNPNLTGVTNGVLEASHDTILFRQAKPEDYVSMCTNTMFDPDMSWKDLGVMKCMKWFSQVFSDKSLLHHFLKFAASCLRAKNSDKIFAIWSGLGDNSKSMIVKLFEVTFNSYCIKFPVSMLNDKGTNSGSATPQLARAKSSRVAFLDEPEDDTPMQKGIIKRFTGGDSFFARLLHDNGGEVEATFKMVLMCNKVPIIPNADKAIKNRTRIFPFMSTWSKDAPESEEEQMRCRVFKMRNDFEQGIKGLSSSFLWIMTQYYPYYISEGMRDPEIVKEATESYWRDNDVYAQFVADTIQVCRDENGNSDPSAKVSLGDIYTEFKNWFREGFPSVKVPERSMVKSELSSRWGKMNGNSWHGIRLLSEDSSDGMASLESSKKPVKINIL